MREIKVYKNLAELNELSTADAEAAFLACCGSSVWAKKMSAARPFSMIEDVFKKAESVWFSLGSADHLEAFRAHPQIGSKEKAHSQDDRAAAWSAGEQSDTANADCSTLAQLAEINRLYHDRFGFIFIVCATGRTAEEMLAICRARLNNSADTELKIATEEQMKITEIRLTKLLEQ